MKKKPKLPVIIGICTIVILAIIAAAYLLYRPSAGPISGAVTEVFYQENIAENGRYIINVKDSLHREYTIDATAFMNSPAPASSFGKSCVGIPKLQKGDKVEFLLPKGLSSSSFATCYKGDETPYFFRVK